jgi:uroporphyrinogen-III synthase
MRILVTRPQSDATTLQARLEALQHDVVLEPLLTLSFENAEPVDMSEAQALIVTSKNALRGLAAQEAIAIAAKLPTFTVGSGTAAEARALGFDLILAGQGTARDLVPEIVANLDPHAGPLVHPAGDVLAGDLAGDLAQHGFRVEQPVVYRMQPAKGLSRLVIAELGAGELDAVLLLSPRTAEVWVEIIRRHRLERVVSPLLHVCLSAAVARRLAPLGPLRIATAAKPTLDALLDIVT